LSGNDDRVLLDINYPAFQDELFELDAAEFKKGSKTLKKIKGLTWQDLFRDSAKDWEHLKSAPGKYSVRLSQSCRAIVRREGSLMRFQSLHLDRDGTYGNK